MRAYISLTSCIAALAACATANPPQELVDARTAYQHAEQGPAQRYKPDELHEAHDALDQAEQAFKNDSAGDRTKTAAYVAQRKAQLADTDGATAEAMAGRESATDQLTQVATQGLQRAQGQLRQTETALAGETQARADAEKGRSDAEQRAKEALDKLALASVPVKQDNRGTIITLPGSVLFASNKSTLLASAQDKLNQVASALKDEQDHQITIEGFTDSRGSSDSNQSLSERRAQSVRDYLVAQGLPTEHVNSMGKGAENPVADNSTAEGRANNRRVEIIVKPIEPR